MATRPSLAKAFQLLLCKHWAGWNETTQGASRFVLEGDKWYVHNIRSKDIIIIPLLFTHFENIWIKLLLQKTFTKRLSRTNLSYQHYCWNKRIYINYENLMNDISNTLIYHENTSCVYSSLHSGRHQYHESRGVLTSDKAGFFSNKKYDSYKCWTCAELCEAFTFLMENIYVQFEGMVYQQIVGIPMGTNCAPLIADLFLFCYERDFMSSLHKSKRYDLIDMFNDTSRYLDDIFTIDNPEFEKHIPDIYPRELQLNKANTSDKETFFLDLNIKVIGSDVHTSVYDKRDDFGFPIVNFPWLSGDVPRLPSYGVYISQLVRFARCCTSVSDFNSKNLQLTSKLLTQGYRYHKLRKTFGKFFRSYSDLLSKFGEISFQEYVTEGISHPVFYGDLVYKLRRVRCEANFVSSGSKIVKRLRRRKYDPLIIENTIGLVLGPSTALYRSFLEHCTLTNKAVGTIWRDLSKPPQRRQGPDPRPLWLLVGTPLVLGPELASRRAEHSHSGGCHYIFLI